MFFSLSQEPEFLFIDAVFSANVMQEAFSVMIDIDSVSYRYPFQSGYSLKNFSLKIDPGECSVCTGTSGCGKSTAVRLMNGLVPNYFRGELSGRVRVLGKDNTLRTVREVSQNVGTLFQDPEQQFFAMNVEDEIGLSLEWKGFSREEMNRRAEAAIHAFGLSVIRRSSVYELSEGQKQKVVLAGLVAAAPEILVLDEPSANLDPESTADLAFLLAGLKQNGTTIFISDHRLYWLGFLADSATVMEEGEARMSGCVDILEDVEVRKDFSLRKTGITDTRDSLPEIAAAGGFISADSVSFAWRGKDPLFRNLSFGIEKGQVVAVTGPNGAGKTTMAKLLAGLAKPSEGKILIEGEPASRSDLLRETALVLQNTDHQLYMRTALEELSFTAWKKRRQQDVMAMSRSFLDRFGLGHLEDRHPQSLSGGEKQRLVIACAMIGNPRILILDEPTSGLDGKNLGLMAKNIMAFARAGGAVIVITHDLELMEMVCTHRLDMGKLER